MKKTKANQLAKDLAISNARGYEAIMKAKLISEISQVIENQDITHEEIANFSGLSRTSVTGILSGSLQKVTIDRILRLVEAVGLEAEIKIRKRKTIND